MPHTARAQPTIVGGRVFVGSQRRRRCMRSMRRPAARSGRSRRRPACVPRSCSARSRGGGDAAYFGDGALERVRARTRRPARSCGRRSSRRIRNAHITGAPTLYQNRLYVPVASGEEGQGNNPQYECCTFRGSLVALNIANGDIVWKTYTIRRRAAHDRQERRRRRRGGGRRAPASGASPTVDAKRRVVYAATGNMYTEPQQTTSDAVMAFDLDNGKIVWSAQVTPKDVFVVGCNRPNAGELPGGDDLGPDFDFGNAPILATMPAARDLIVIGQKSGDGWAFDPDKQGRRGVAIPAPDRAARSAAWSAARPSTASTRISRLPTATRPTAGECTRCVSTPASACGWRRRRRC